MIKVGLTGWGDHDDLYPDSFSNRNKLITYSRHFPVVEVDSSFYAIQSEKNYTKWAKETPSDFSFVVKAYQGLTGHLRGSFPFSKDLDMFAAFKQSIQPLLEAGKLKAVLFQYPPWFDCQRPHVEALRWARERMGDIPIALEFRNATWFSPEMREKTLAFMKREGWIHSICDEPQAGIGSVPIVLHATHPELTVVRFHGRNTAGWSGSHGKNWREVRYLYRYSTDELLEWKKRVERLQEQCKEICILFNNNSGGDAAANAKQLMDLLGLKHEQEMERQLDLFHLD